MKKEYVKPILEVVKFQEEEIETSPDSSTNDVGVGDWFGE